MDFLTKYLTELRLTRLENEAEAGLWVTSLPWPRALQQDLSLSSNSDANPSSTYTLPIGQWPGEAPGKPRRLLMVADGGNHAPLEISLSPGGKSTPMATEKFSAEMELFARSPHTEYVWERHLLRLRYGAHSVGLAMGLKTGDETHWWEACRLVVVEETPECLVIEMGGAIPHRLMTLEEFKSHQGLKNPYLHKHNWLNGHIYARLHSNGVCEVFAHHINSKFVDDGLDLVDAVPVIGIKTETTTHEREELCGAWDGTRDGIQLGAVRFDLREAARLATPSQPGQITQADDFLVWQPYEGMELYGGLCPDELRNDPFISHAEDHIVPRGMARTLRFSLSLSDRSPRVARYLAPAWWYGVCEEFLPQPLLPVANSYDDAAQSASEWITKYIVSGGFEDGSVPRNAAALKDGDANTRCEPGWEGEMPYAQFLRAWRTGDAGEYSCALRSAYHFADVVVDHAAKAVRMHGYPPHAFAVPMNRVQGCIAAYLETGDPYLLETAESVTANSYWTHKNSWPRMAVGRDACFIRSAVLLYRYCGDEFFRTIARDAAITVMQSQHPNGSFGDQGGGAGIHMWSGYVTKPWMGLLALGGVLDYLELFPDEPLLAEGVRNFADWLMVERFDHDGVTGWSYQHDFNGRREFYLPQSGQQVTLPTPNLWHQESLGRLLTYCALRFDQPEYFDSWAQSYAGQQERREMGDHSISAALQFIPWVQAKLWRATLTDDGVCINPPLLGALMPEEGQLFTPEGKRNVQRKQAECTA